MSETTETFVQLCLNYIVNHLWINANVGVWRYFFLAHSIQPIKFTFRLYFCWHNTFIAYLFVERKIEIEFVLSRRGRPQLLYNGYLYNSDAMSNGRTYWRCSETRRGSCVARLVSTSDTVYEKQPIHDHEPKRSRLEGKRILDAISYREYLKTLAKEKKDSKRQEMDIFQVTECWKCHFAEK